MSTSEQVSECDSAAQLTGGSRQQRSAAHAGRSQQPNSDRAGDDPTMTQWSAWRTRDHHWNEGIGVQQTTRSRAHASIAAHGGLSGESQRQAHREGKHAAERWWCRPTESG